MEFRETLLAAQRNQQQKSSEKLYYKARFDPPKKEQKQKDKLSANIQKFLAKKDEEEKQKKLEALKKRDELLAMRDPKALRKIQKTLKVIKSANKSVIEDAVDRDNTAVTREGPDQPDQDDYGYESQAAAAIYEKMMQKYSKLPEEPEKFPTASTSVKKDLNGTRERVKQALQHEDDPVPHKRRRRKEGGEKDLSPPPSNPEPEKKEKEKPDKNKIRRPLPPPMDFNQLLKLAEQKKSEPLDGVAKKQLAEPEPERLMTKRQKREFEEEMARRQKRQERMDADKGRKVQKEEKPLIEKPSGFGRIPKIGDKGVNSQRHNSPKLSEKERHEKDRAEKLQRERDRARAEKAEKEKERIDRDKEKTDRDIDKAERTDRERFDKIKAEKERLNKLRAEKERLEKMKAEKERDIDRLEKLRAERERIERDIDRLNKDRDRLEKEKEKLDSMKNDKPNKPVDRSNIIPKEQRHEQGVKKNIDLKSQNTYRIDKNSNEKRYDIKNFTTQGKPVPKLNKDYDLPKNGIKDKAQLVKQKALSNDRSPRLNGHDRPEGSKTVPKRPEVKKPVHSNAKPQVAPNKHKISNSFDFDKHVNSLGKKPDGARHSGDVKRKPNKDDRRGQKRRVVNSDSEYDSEMDDFIDDGDEQLDYSTHIKEIFGYDKSRYRDMDDDDDPSMESSFARQQREEYISKKIGIMEDLEDMRMEAMEKKKTKKKLRISDD